MRRNLTISFDEDFIREMDTDRGKLSRGKWIERGAPNLTNALADGIAEGQRVVAARVSPKLRSGIKPRPKKSK